jgi:hypothetical protein
MTSALVMAIVRNEGMAALRLDRSIMHADASLSTKMERSKNRRLAAIAKYVAASIAPECRLIHH